MRKPLVSLSLMLVALQACSGKPAGFQGETVSLTGTSVSNDGTGRTVSHRDAESGDAVGRSADNSNKQIIETDSIEMDSQVVYEGMDTTVAVSTDATATEAMSSSSNSDNTTSAGTSMPTDSSASGSTAASGDTSASGSTAASGDTSASSSTSASADTSTSSGGSASTGAGSTTETNNSAAPLSLTITVPSTSLRAGSAPMQATARLSGQSSAPHVAWSVKASSSQNAGIIDENGLYTAPSTGGEYDVIISAVLSDDPSVTAAVTIRLVAAEQIFVGCQQGSEFFPITADVYQLPVNTTKLPDFSKIGAKVTTVCMDQYNVAPRDWSTGFPGVNGLYEWFALRTQTHIMATKDGTYTFKLNSDDGAKLYINGKLIIDNDGQHAPRAREGSVVLTAGEHTLSIDYFQGPRYQIALELFWKTPGASSYVYVPKASFK